MNATSTVWSLTHSALASPQFLPAAAAGEALRSAREQLTAEQQLQAERLLAVAQEMAPDVAAAMATSRAGPAQDVAT
jgi:hypothetical protein